MTEQAPTAQIRALIAAGDITQATAILKALIDAEFALDARDITINRDQYSLNSVNGFLRAGNGQAYFFKFHQEEGESETLAEYYNAELLAEAGYPVDLPAMASRSVGRQILLYRRREQRKFVDVCRDCDLDPASPLAPQAERAQAWLDRLVGARYLATHHAIDAAQSAAEPIHRLFHDRLVSRAGDGVPSRLQRFYIDQPFRFPGLTLNWAEIRHLTWQVNGIDYAQSLDALFAAATDLLAPAKLTEAGGVVAHGDAHNANLWFAPEDPAEPLVMYDPAFAGRHVPALLAEVKATFHNILAHPLWLYDPALAADIYRGTIERRGDRLIVRHDWQLPPLRQAFLAQKMTLVWQPLLRHLKERDCLPAHWRQILRAALFCCPTLVRDLRADGSGNHNEISSLIGFSVAVLAGSEPAQGKSDFFSRLLDQIAP